MFGAPLAPLFYPAGPTCAAFAANHDIGHGLFCLSRYTNGHLASLAVPMSDSQLVVTAPLSGYVCALEEIPDPVFAERMVGDGAAIDPSSQVLLAPIAGTVVEIHPSRHAITLRAANGIELLIHIGLDTVLLRGEGFFPLVETGAEVSVGQPLIDFDADHLALTARSLITAIVVSNGERVERISVSSGRVTAGCDRLMTIHLKQDHNQPSARSRSSGPQLTSPTITVRHAGGLHARPAAQLAHSAKQFRSELTLHHGLNSADARSVVALLGLNIKHLDEVVISAVGSDAEQALAALARLLSEPLHSVGEAPAPSENSLWVAPGGEARKLPGVAASPGVVAGTIHHLKRDTLQYQARGRGVDIEQQRLLDALQQARLGLEELQQQMRDDGAHERASIFAAHVEILDDPTLYQEARRHIYAGKSAAYAWDQSIQAQRAIVARADNSLIAARAIDLDDIGRRVLAAVLGIHADEIHCPPGSILVAEDLTPSDTVRLDKAQVSGFCTVRGSATSHVAILARSLHIPAVTGVDARVLQLTDGQPVILDGSLGQLIVDPTDSELARAQVMTANSQRQFAADERPAATIDGRLLRVSANISSIGEAQRAVAAGADGVGLLRTEFLYLERSSEPGEVEQARVLGEIADILGPLRSLVVRTLDIGGDKPVPYLSMPTDENPELGLRGIRFGLIHPNILRRQVRAVLRTADRCNMRLMFPMVSSVDEFRLARQVVAEECERLDQPMVPVGAMIEIPAAALKSAQLAELADFFSIGTNDLTQYTLAMDRGHPRLAPFLDALDPAVLRLIALAVEGAATARRPVSVCGSVAGDPCAVPLLIGLGVDELSMNPELVPPTKALIRRLNRRDCENWARVALALPDAQSVRAMMTKHLTRLLPLPTAEVAPHA